MKTIFSTILFATISISQLAKADSEIDWGTFPVRVEEYNFRCDRSSDSSMFEFFSMPKFISKNEFRASHSGIKLRHDFAYFFAERGVDACDYKRQLLEIASQHGGNLDVRILTSDASYQKYTSISEYGVASCIEETKETLKIEFAIALTVISKNQRVNRLYFGECKENESM